MNLTELLSENYWKQSRAAAVVRLTREIGSL